MAFCHSRCYTINLLFLCTNELSLTTDYPPRLSDNTTVSIKLLLEFKYGDFHWPNIPSSTIAREVRICLKSWRVQGSALTGTGLWLLLSGLKDIQVTWQLGTLIQDCLHKLLNNDVLSFLSLVEQEDIHVHVLYHVFYFLLCYHWWHAVLTCINY